MSNGNEKGNKYFKNSQKKEFNQKLDDKWLQLPIFKNGWMES